MITSKDMWGGMVGYPPGPVDWQSVGRLRARFQTHYESLCTPAKPLEIKPVDPKFASFSRIAGHAPGRSQDAATLAGGDL